MIELRRTGVSFYNTARDIIKGLGARTKSQASELKALKRVFSLASFQFHRLDQHQHWYGGTKYAINQNPSACLPSICPDCALLAVPPPNPKRCTRANCRQVYSASRASPSASLRPLTRRARRRCHRSSFAQGASACANHLALAAGMTLCYTNRERMRKSTILRRSPAAPE
jgi:hypothetical protein